MNAKEFLQTIREFLNKNSEIELTSPTMYDPNKLEQKVSFIVFGKNELGIYKKFTITIEETAPPVEPERYNIQ
jgi:hypothetical protein